jgi:hypothetical protein
MSNPTTSYNRFREAYQRMAREARYRPAAPGDGFGSVDLTRTQLEDDALLDEEAGRYARTFLEEEDTNSFWIGCSHYPTNRAFLFIIEAARLLCGGAYDRTAAKLIEMALAEIQEASHA